MTGVQTSLGEDFRVTRFVYDEKGNLVETINALGNSSFQTTDEFGRPLTITDRRGNTTTLEYDQLIGSPTLDKSEFSLGERLSSADSAGSSELTLFTGLNGTMRSSESLFEFIVAVPSEKLTTR